MNRFRMAVPIVALALMLTACPAGNTSTTQNPSASAGGSGGLSGATIEVTSLWGGAEATAFLLTP
jgi:ABC-type glycerol-3-phosphate transport system substrate-binding protein